MEGRKYRRRKIILIYELIETHISVGMLEISEKEKATQSSILAWEMPWAEEPGGLQSTGFATCGTQLRGQTTTTEIHISVHIQKEGDNPCGLLLQNFSAQGSNNLLIHPWHFAFFFEFFMFESQSFFLCCKLLPLYLYFFSFNFAPKRHHRLFSSSVADFTYCTFLQEPSLWGPLA